MVKAGDSERGCVMVCGVYKGVWSQSRCLDQGQMTALVVLPVLRAPSCPVWQLQQTCDAEGEELRGLDFTGRGEAHPGVCCITREDHATSKRLRVGTVFGQLLIFDSGSVF